MLACVCPQVALLFPQPFWRNIVGNADFFGHIANSKEQRGMFGVFYDLSPKSCVDAMTLSSPSTLDSKPKSFNKAPPLPHWILVTTVSGDGLVPYDRMSDSEIVEKCVDVLRKMFPKETIPAPLGSRVSRWGADPFAQMSYSYAAVGSGGEDYDAMAEDIEERIFFAGEASFVMSYFILYCTDTLVSVCVCVCVCRPPIGSIHRL